MASDGGEVEEREIRGCGSIKKNPPSKPHWKLLKFATLEVSIIETQFGNEIKHIRDNKQSNPSSFFANNLSKVNLFSG